MSTTGEHVTEPLLVGMVEAQRLLGLPRTKIFDMCRAGELPSFKIGRHRKIPRAALDAWIGRKLGAGP